MKRGRKPLGKVAMTPAQRQKRWRAGLKRKARQTHAVSPPHFRGAADFLPVFNAARKAAVAVHGERWDLCPEAFIWARLPKGWGTAFRDYKLPVARFWPKGKLPVAPEYAARSTIEWLDATHGIIAISLAGWESRPTEYRATGRSPHQKKAAREMAAD